MVGGHALHMTCKHQHGQRDEQWRQDGREGNNPSRHFHLRHRLRALIALTLEFTAAMFSAGDRFKVAQFHAPAVSTGVVDVPAGRDRPAFPDHQLTMCGSPAPALAQPRARIAVSIKTATPRPAVVLV